MLGDPNAMTVDTALPATGSLLPMPEKVTGGRISCLIHFTDEEDTAAGSPDSWGESNSLRRTWFVLRKIYTWAQSDLPAARQAWMLNLLCFVSGQMCLKLRGAGIPL